MPQIQRWDWKNWTDISRDELYEILQLRQAVFVVEQDCPYLDADGQDQHAAHVLGWSTDNVLIAYSRVFLPQPSSHTAIIGRVIIHPNHRGLRLGYDLMRQSEALARHNSRIQIASFTLSAQAHLRDFYGHLGYTVSGPGYDEDGIPHLPMQKKLH